MIVIRREWLSKRAEEAILHLGQGDCRIVAFCQPCTFTEGDVLNDPILGISVSNVRRVAQTDPESSVRDGEKLSHSLVATVQNAESGIVRLGTLAIEIEDAMPGDVVDGDRVAFNVNRLDVIE